MQKFHFSLTALLMGIIGVTGFTSVRAQTIIGVGSRYDNSFREWNITTEDDNVRGELRMRWTFRDDWTEWDVNLGDHHATIEQKWKEDPNLWEIRCNGVTVNARTTWPNEFNRWKLTDGTHTFNWRTQYANMRDEWFLETKNDGFFQVYTYWEGDPREWVVIDELPEDVSLAMRLAMIFLALHFSTPRL